MSVPTYKEGESKVNIGQFIRVVLPNQYSMEPQMASLIEIVANSLDARSSKIEINIDAKNGILEVIDNGEGMNSSAFVNYHNIASTTKTRGNDIGFVGQGAKLALLFCDKVETETCSGNYRGWSEWHFDQGLERAPYKIYGDLKTLKEKGTKVKLYLNATNRRFYDEGKIINTLYEHYYPLVDQALAKGCPIYPTRYPHGVQIYLNGEPVSSPDIIGRLIHKKDIYLRRRGGAINTWGFFGVLTGVPSGVPIPGVMISCWGKVIERTYFKKKPKEEETIFGWIEAPYLLACVTTDKCRFIQGDKSYQRFFMKAQAEFDNWLKEVGLLDSSIGDSRVFEDLERELTSILSQFPDLNIFARPVSREVEFPMGGEATKNLVEGTQLTQGTMGGSGSGSGTRVTPGPNRGKGPSTETGNQISAETRQRTIHGPNIRIISEPRADQEKEAWFDGTTCTINEAHPTYIRAGREGRACLHYHRWKAIFTSIVEYVIGNKESPDFSEVFDLEQRFFRAWGQQG